MSADGGEDLPGCGARLNTACASIGHAAQIAEQGTTIHITGEFSGETNCCVQFRQLNLIIQGGQSAEIRCPLVTRAPSVALRTLSPAGSLSSSPDSFLNCQWDIGPAGSSSMPSSFSIVDVKVVAFAEGTFLASNISAFTMSRVTMIGSKVSVHDIPTIVVANCSLVPLVGAWSVLNVLSSTDDTIETAPSTRRGNVTVRNLYVTRGRLNFVSHRVDVHNVTSLSGDFLLKVETGVVKDVHVPALYGVFPFRPSYPPVQMINIDFADLKLMGIGDPSADISELPTVVFKGGLTADQLTAISVNLQGTALAANISELTVFGPLDNFESYANCTLKCLQGSSLGTLKMSGMNEVVISGLHLRAADFYEVRSLSLSNIQVQKTGSNAVRVGRCDDVKLTRVNSQNVSWRFEVRKLSMLDCELDSSAEAPVVQISTFSNGTKAPFGNRTISLVVSLTNSVIRSVASDSPAVEIRGEFDFRNKTKWPLANLTLGSGTVLEGRSAALRCENSRVKVESNTSLVGNVNGCIMI